MPHPKTLIFTTGETPQVVTETLWALSHRDPPWLPDRILLATTARGAEVYRNGRSDARGVLPPLLGAGGRLAELWRQLAPGRPLPEPKVLVPEGPHGPIEDLRTEAEVEAFAETLLKAVAGVTAGQEGELHLSLAGGRKTMSFLAGQVLSLLARPQDVLSHVLIEPASLEFRPDFWWPGDGSPGSEDAQVGLHQVPFLRARAWVDPETILAGPEGSRFRAAIARANLGLADPDVALDLSTCRVEAGGLSVTLTPREAAALALVFVAAKRGVELDSYRAGRKTLPMLDGKREAARRLWAWLVAATDLPAILQGDRVEEDDGHVPPHRYLAHQIDRLAADCTYSGAIGPGISRARDRLRNAFSPALADRILTSKPPSTRLPPGRITVRVPAALATHPDRPPEVEAAPD
ncbi:CRISPR-associated ring nuclease Csm6 [Thermaurantiacus tibetensis]|uniref:CRISPR-associated ring nuclease Csm6 n=1 Tax=Thermaurantiacus tibetensis TaxID=2759035 RepID=UPI00188E835B|nr:CRISPR-associated ring nuclease Csm6 [Thermaurantiacus tibetensis]